MEDGSFLRPPFDHRMSFKISPADRNHVMICSPRPAVLMPMISFSKVDIRIQDKVGQLEIDAMNFCRFYFERLQENHRRVDLEY